LAIQTSTDLPTTALIQAASGSAMPSADQAGVSGATSQRITQVLQELPNQVLNDGVTAELTSASLELYAVTASFTGRNTGDQHPVKMNVEGCNVDGCQPRFTGMGRQFMFSSVGSGDFSTGAASLPTVGVSAGTDITNTVTAGDSVHIYSAASTSSHGDTKKLSTVGTGTFTIEGSLAAAAAGYGMVFIVPHSANAANKFVKSETYEITRGTTEATECSGRGLCDGETGECACHSGYTGEACHVQTVLV